MAKKKHTYAAAARKRRARRAETVARLREEQAEPKRAPKPAPAAEEPQAEEPAAPQE